LKPCSITGLWLAGESGPERPFLENRLQGQTSQY
jgi:hypothetical protein